MAEEGAQAQYSDGETANDEWHSEFRKKRRRYYGKDDRERRQAEILPLLVTQVAEAGGGVIDSSRVHRA